MTTTSSLKNTEPQVSLVEVASWLFLVACLVVLVPAQQYVTAVSQEQRAALTCWNNVKSLAEQIDAYGKAHRGLYPKTLADLKLDHLPQCPSSDVNKGNSYDLGYQVHLDGEAASRFTLHCQGSAHALVGLHKNEPYYDSLYGMTPTSLNFKK